MSRTSRRPLNFTLCVSTLPATLPASPDFVILPTRAPTPQPVDAPVFLHENRVIFPVSM